MEAGATCHEEGGVEAGVTCIKMPHIVSKMYIVHLATRNDACLRMCTSISCPPLTGLTMEMEYLGPAISCPPLTGLTMEIEYLGPAISCPPLLSFS